VQGAVFLLTVKANQKTRHRQIVSQFQGKRTIPFVATDQEISHGRGITWTEVVWLSWTAPIVNL
jgi:hypothetical protein